MDSYNSNTVLCDNSAVRYEPVKDWAAWFGHRCKSTFISGATASLSFEGSWIQVTGFIATQTIHNFSYTIDGDQPIVQSVPPPEDFKPHTMVLFDTSTLPLLRHTLKVTNLGYSLTLVNFTFGGSNGTSSRVSTSQIHTQSITLSISTPLSLPSDIKASNDASSKVSLATPTTTIVTTSVIEDVVSTATQTVPSADAGHPPAAHSTGPSSSTQASDVVSMPTGTILGVSLGAIAFLLLICGGVWWLVWRRRRAQREEARIVIYEPWKGAPELAEPSMYGWTTFRGEKTLSSEVETLPPYGYTCPEPQLSEGMSTLVEDRRNSQGVSEAEGPPLFTGVLAPMRRAQSPT